MSGDMTHLLSHQPDQPVAWRKGRALSAGMFLLDVERLAKALPEHRYVFNLCEDRYRFMAGFAAALQRGQITLMPPNNTPDAVNQLQQSYPDSYCLVDKPFVEITALQIDTRAVLREESGTDPKPLMIEQDQTAAILFTSGSSGEPKMHAKCWGDLQHEASLALDHFPFRTRAIKSLLATVPAQHMYGLATATLFPWQGAIGIEANRPFFPADVAQCLARLPTPRVLITTPLHLRACVSAGLDWPAIDFVISATAPLTAELAAEAEQCMATEVYEIYGSTETGSIASRRTVDETAWRLYPGISIDQHPDGCEFKGGHLGMPVILSDRIKIIAANEFNLLGRDSDMLKIAGKRASLGDLNHKLLSIPGVLDGIFLTPGDSASPDQRLTALAVAPALSKTQIMDALAKRIDAAFLPRPLHLVNSLPRNATGKLPKAALEKLLKSLAD